MKSESLRSGVILSLACLFLGTGVNSVAQSDQHGWLTPVTGHDLYHSFLGNTMDGTYKQPRRRSGTAIFTESYYADGSTYYREGEISDIGTWIIRDETQICFEYTGTLAGVESCFYVFVSGTCFYSFNPRNVRNGKPVSSNAWSVKTVIRGDLASCDDLVS